MFCVFSLLLASSINAQYYDNCVAICNTYTSGKDECMLNCEDLKTEQPQKQSLQSSTADETYSDECLDISSTTVCSPWSSGYRINKTELSLVYNIQINSAADWNEAVVGATSGGQKQRELWNKWAGCSGYQGEPIQFSRSYTCLTDIFLFSAGCNVKVSIS